MEARSFRAYASRKQALVFVAAILPMLTLMAWSLVIASDDPGAIRAVFAGMLAIFSLLLVAPVRGVLLSGPMLELSADGFTWRAWSDETIPWSAVKGWRVVRYLGSEYISIDLHAPQDHRATTTARWTQALNHWVRQGDISIPGGGMNRTMPDIAAAFARFAPKPPLPDDPRLAARLQRARGRAGQGQP